MDRQVWVVGDPGHRLWRPGVRGEDISHCVPDLHLCAWLPLHRSSGRDCSDHRPLPRLHPSLRQASYLPGSGT